MEKGRIGFSITFLESGEILNKMSMFKYFLHNLEAYFPRQFQCD